MSKLIIVFLGFEHHQPTVSQYIAIQNSSFVGAIHILGQYELPVRNKAVMHRAVDGGKTFFTNVDS